MYEPSLHQPISKPLGAYGVNTIEARSLFYDKTSFSYRLYASTEEVNEYLGIRPFRMGYFLVYIENETSFDIWWYKDGTDDEDLVRYNPVIDLYYTKQEIDDTINGLQLDGFVKIDGSTPFGGNQSMDGHQLKDLAAATDDNDAVRKKELVQRTSYKVIEW